MRKQFYTISNGTYANILFSNFTKKRVEKELDEFLSFNFFKRCGGGIGVTRLIRAMKLSNVLYDKNSNLTTKSQTMKTRMRNTQTPNSVRNALPV